MYSVKKYSFLFLLLGAGLFVLVSWRWNVALAAWLAPVFLMRFFRGARTWPVTLLAVPLVWAASYANKVGAWGMEPALMAAASLLASRA